MHKTTIIILDKTVPRAAPKILILENPNSIYKHVIKKNMHHISHKIAYIGISFWLDHPQIACTLDT
jgi:hypothetical protein